jgi:hypothetical protein
VNEVHDRFGGVILVLTYLVRPRAALTLIGILLLSRAGSAHPFIQLEVPGPCPPRDRLRASLDELLASGSFTQNEALWLLRVSRTDENAVVQVRLLKPDGDVALQRRLDSTDCAALADAIAIIVAVHLHNGQLRVAHKSAPATSQPVAHPQGEQMPPAESWQAPGGGPGGQSPPDQFPEPGEYSTEITVSGRRKEAGVSMRLFMGLAGGVDVAPEQGTVAAAGNLDLGIQPFSTPLFFRLAGAVGGPTEQSPRGERVQIRAFNVRLDVGAHFGGRWWFQPAIGAGAGFFDVVALDLPDRPTVLRAHPVLAVVLASGVRLYRAMSLRLELVSLFYPSSDSYLIEPTGEVGESPWVSLCASLGLQADFFL